MESLSEGKRHTITDPLLRGLASLPSEEDDALDAKSVNLEVLCHSPLQTTSHLYLHSMDWGSIWIFDVESDLYGTYASA
eukprot:CAMPEP_0178381852 /NCGR_PEP_ID=MMETSP0689_2-20121128/6198_1 /TAXON_ID=160604 /ORGANISM="Amphidinium massartii, Strain CS-259" /LENGTH=78 /DNA_ID=CAMNT_0020002051 /DNA_START=336 /DNA_END=572 /DNA_ORIENTATION=-